MKKTILLVAAVYLGIHFIDAQSIKQDHLFGNNGIVKTDVGKYYAQYSGNTGFKVLVGTDGSIYDVVRASSVSFISKRLPNGSINSAYGNKGFSDAAGITGHDAIMQPDGKILIVGAADNRSYSNFALTRYNTDGSFDSSFSNDGTQLTEFGSGFDFAVSAALQDDGKIVVAGYANEDFAVARYNPDGSPDSSFSEDGRQITKFEPGPSFANSVAIQKDGRIVVAGYTWNGTDNDFALARYTADGSPDSTFSGDGKETTSFGGSDYGYSAAIQNDGKILVAGYASFGLDYVLALARYTADGSADSTFDGDGKQTTTYNSGYSYPISIVLQNSGKIIVTHYILNGKNYDFAVTRYNTDGSLDTGFAVDGKQTTDFNGGDDYALAAAIQPDGKIVVTGQANIEERVSDFALCRYNSDGTPDSTFNKDGKLHDKLKQGYTVYRSTAVQKDGKIVAAGYTWNGMHFKFAVSRFNANGSPDSSFSDDGTKTDSFGPGDDYAHSVAVQDDGKIVAAGLGFDGKYYHFAFARYNSDGNPDKTFSGDGKELLKFDSADEFINAIAMQNDGRILAAGVSNNNTAVLRLNADGEPDPAFGTGGISTTSYGSNVSAANAMSLQKNGKIVVAGNAGAGFTLARYNADGNPDKNFADNGKLTGSFGYVYSTGNSVAVQNDGKIVLVADVSYLESTMGFAVARFTPDGTADSSFGQDGVVVPDDVLSHVNSVIIYNSGKILAGGSWGNHSSITCINSAGKIDSAFGDNGTLITRISGQQDMINAITIAGNRLYTAGTAACPGNLGTLAKYLLDENQPSTGVVTADSTHNLSGQPLASGALFSAGIKLPVNDTADIRLYPNPSHSILNISTSGLQTNKESAISIISSTGIILKTIHTHSSAPALRVNVSSLASGTYTLKMTCGDTVMYRQFLKM